MILHKLLNHFELPFPILKIGRIIICRNFEFLEPVLNLFPPLLPIQTSGWCMLIASGNDGAEETTEKHSEYLDLFFMFLSDKGTEGSCSAYEVHFNKSYLASVRLKKGKKKQWVGRKGSL
jgi:hypothetical protein